MMAALTGRHPGINLGPHHGAADKAAEIVVFGFWVFLMSDLVLFGLLLATYVTTLTPMAMAGGPGPGELFDLRTAFAETVILLASSLTFGLATLAMRHRHADRVILGWMGLTFALGAAFVVLEVYDLVTMAAKGGVPSRSGFLSAFYALVPLHGIHVAIGMVWIAFMAAQLTIVGQVTVVKTRILRLALFWHFLDVVWIGIFTIVYVMGRA